MQIKDKIVLVTGGANGIGGALCRRFANEGASAVIVADIDIAAASEVAKVIGGVALRVDVAREAEVKALVELALSRYGRIDLFCCNAGIICSGGEETPDAEWQRMWEINVLAHVYAARAALPSMIERGQGYFLQTISAAGLLSIIGSAPYAVTKHASLGFAEWLAITYGERGIRVSTLCPQGVRTSMLTNDASGIGAFLAQTAVNPEDVADAAVKGIAEERFLILPHPEVATYFRHKANDYDRWIGSMQSLQAAIRLK
jgi:NAD(P)-dependent dehydrogenase (short-subunit alcohol dehydrogenase family)